MDTFKDEVYENMDDISKIVEPFEYNINNELAQFPDEIEVDKIMLESIITSTPYFTDVMSEDVAIFVRRKASTLGLSQLVKEIQNNWDFVRSMFHFVVEPDEEEGKIYFNGTTGEVTGGKIFIRKIKIAVDDNDIEKTIAGLVGTVFNANFKEAKDVNKSRFNEIAEMFGAKDARKQRAWSKKTNLLLAHYKGMVIDKKLVIKDVELFKRFLNWNVLYIKNGSLPAMANIARLKIMMRNGLPIYSIKEEQV
jgi:hypothetical protein